MVLARHTVHPLGLSLKTKERVYMMRKVDKMSYVDIAAQVYNMKGKHPYWKVVRAAFRQLSATSRSAKKDKYHNCGRDTVLTDELVQWLVKKMLVLRAKTECTSTDLQRLLAQKKHVTVEASTIRRALNLEGYYYLPRAKKPKYDKAQRAHRVYVSRPFAKCTKKTLPTKANICVDGVVFTRPPAKPVARENYIHSDTQKVWRRRDEQHLPELFGYDHYQKQVPPSRMIPLWGGLGPGGFAPILWHSERKTDNEEWSAAVRAGSLTSALRAVNLSKRFQIPYTLLICLCPASRVPSGAFMA